MWHYHPHHHYLDAHRALGGSVTIPTSPPVTSHEPPWDAIAVSLSELSNSLAVAMIFVGIVTVLIAVVGIIAAFAWKDAITTQAKASAIEEARSEVERRMDVWLEQHGERFIRERAAKYMNLANQSIINSTNPQGSDDAS